MKVSDIVQELDELERKRDEINDVLVGVPSGEAKDVLQRALSTYQKMVDTFLDSEFEPVASVLYLNATPNPLSLNVEDTIQLDVVATLSDGTTKNVTVNKRPMMMFRDFDQLYNNSGYIVSVDVGSYTGDERVFEIVKTNSGFDVDDSVDTQGLQVVATGNPNEYHIADINGNPIGITFTTNGNETKGDNWLINVFWVTTGTTYASDDPSVATVSESGLVTGVGGGTANISVRNGLKEVTIPITVVDTIAPEPPSIMSINAIVNGAEIAFEPSVSPDTISYNVYVNTVLVAQGVTDTPTTVTINGADGTTSYSIYMTAVDASGNESTPSNTVTVVPLAPATP